MNTLNLSKGFSPLASRVTFDIPFTLSYWPGGEPNIRLQTLHTKSTFVSTRILSPKDFVTLIAATDALKRLADAFKATKEFYLFLPYFPGARQDRVVNYGEAFTLKIYADIINNLGYSKVFILDPHSDVATALINNVVALSASPYVQECIQDIPKLDCIVIPDAGASKKVYGYVHDFSNPGKYEIIQALKVRDKETNAITGTTVLSNNLKGKNCLIIDDICDGGATFIALAKELKKKGCGKLYLYVTHGIFSKGLKELNSYFDVIYTTDSVFSIDDPEFNLLNDNQIHKLKQLNINI
jgi:ribose-phosphate pyrophosphokinase